VTGVVNGESVDFHVKVADNTGGETRVIRYVEPLLEYCKFMNMHDEGIDVECSGDVIGF